jgi:hypothetical protein
VFRLLIGHSDDPDTAAAAAEIVAHCKGALAGGQARGGMLFAAIDHDHALLLAAIHDAFPGLALIGCTTDGELSSQHSFSEGSIVLALFVGDAVRAAVGLGRGINKDPTGASARAIAEARQALGVPPVICCITPDGLTIRANAMLASLRAALPNGVPVVGGTAADDWRFTGTQQFCGREVVRDALPVLLLGGGLQVAHAFASGWQPIGLAESVTLSRGYAVQRIGERTAIEFYRHYLGDTMLPSGEHPLAVHDPDGGFYLRAPQSHDLETGSIRFAAEIPAGSRVQLTAASRDDILSATHTAVSAARRGFTGEPSAALVFSCAARKQLLGTRTSEEYTRLRAELGDLPVAGFYGYGEFVPLGSDRSCSYHNETVVVVLLGDVP